MYFYPDQPIQELESLSIQGLFYGLMKQYPNLEYISAQCLKKIAAAAGQNLKSVELTEYVEMNHRHLSSSFLKTRNRTAIRVIHIRQELSNMLWQHILWSTYSEEAHAFFQSQLVIDALAEEASFLIRPTTSNPTNTPTHKPLRPYMM